MCFYSNNKFMWTCNVSHSTKPTLKNKFIQKAFNEENYAPQDALLLTES